MEPAAAETRAEGRAAAGGPGSALTAAPGRAGGAARRRRRGPAPLPAAGGAALGPGASSLLLRRGRLKRNASAAAAPRPAGLPAPGPAAAPPCSRSLDRRALLPRPRQMLPLQPSDRDWVRHQLQRGCVHVLDRHPAASRLRPVLCTLDTTAGEVAARLLQAGPRAGGVLKVPGRGPAGPPPGRAALAAVGGPPPRRASRAGAAPAGCSPGVPRAPDGAGPAPEPESARPSPGAEGSSGRPDPYCSSSSEELEADPGQPRLRGRSSGAWTLSPAASPPPPTAPRDVEGPGGAARDRPAEESPGGDAAAAEKAPPPPTLYVQLHGETARRLEADEKPLQIQNDYLFQLGFGALWRVQEEGLDSEVGCLIRFYAGKPHSTGSSERIQLSGMYNVRKGKMHLPVNRWTRRQVILCGTCLIVSSVKDSVAGKMHVLPLIGGKVEEVKKHQHCLALSSSGPQSQTYYICFDTFTEYLRWLRQVSKVASQRISSVDLSCCSLEHLPANLFYSQDLTHLNLKQNFLRQNPSLPTARGLSELQRFTKLKSLNLSNNHLGDFPLAVCNIPTLAELNVSCNALRAVPAAVRAMHNLQTFLLDGNFLQTLPAELENMHQLSYLGLSFNEFTDFPEVLEKLTAVDKLCMSGNCMETLRLQALRKMPHIKHVDLRLNLIRKLIADEVDFLPHVTQLDLRDNKLGGLDAMVFNNLEVLHCERNQLVTLSICGCVLKALYASSNELVQLDVCPVPNYLSYMDVSRNCLENVPEWVCESRKLEVLDVGHNQICELPARLFCNSSLRKLLAGHNQLTRLPERLDRTSVEVLDVQHNQLLELPPSLLMKADSLRFLNASANKLETLPPAALSEETSSILQELYLTNNNLTDKCVPLLTGHPHLKILHMAYNRLQSFPASKMAKLEELEEIDLSGNKLKAVPTTIMNCRRMHTVTAHSNCIEVFPEVMQLPEIKCVDLSCNELSEVTLPENLPPKLQELDLTGNPRLALDHRTLELLNNIRCFKIDQPSAGDASGAPAVWSHGYTEASGVKNKKLGTAGQKLGGAAVLCHIRHDAVDPGGPFTLTSANVGKCRAVLCRNGKPLPLSRSYAMSCEEELRRLKRHKAIVTEDGKVNGVTESTRILGYTFLHPSVVPRPHVQSVALSPQDEFFILGSKGLWDSLSVEEAVGAARSVPDALAAAKKLCTLAQSYGCRESVSAVVVQLSVPEDSFCCCELAAAATLPPPSPGVFTPASGVAIRERPADGLGAPSSSSGLASEMSSELSTSEMSSEVGSTASDEPPPPGALGEGSPAGPGEPRCALHPGGTPGAFQRQLSSATFSSAFSDNGLDSDDEEPIEGVFSNGSRVEVAVDIHCGRARDGERWRPPAPGLPPEAADEGAGATEDEPGAARRADGAAGTMGRRRGNGSVAPQERSHNVIEVATDAPLRRPGGYFAAPAQPDPDDQFIIPPELEEEVKEMMKQRPPAPPPAPPRPGPAEPADCCCDTPL
ncbi:PH domain leucine-rich repeat-containing protein phosphatase 1 isoform X2 [Cervus canadensis]|uniref:PH domain leucine-rich repeat-containing protein phosphatase 1 isoform X2 n=1 Tax=Cervus canadensis TaxID=1574408 RepID=UPI001CA32BBA|nr:PH domain leucine-rich repeat-containing protein phosphatase 1 isoform X2 [Cervus canadensis]